MLKRSSEATQMQKEADSEKGELNMTKETEQSVDEIIAEQDASELDAATSEKSRPAGGSASPVPLVRPKGTGLAKAARPTSAKSLASDTDRIAAEIKSKHVFEKVGGMAATPKAHGMTAKEREQAEREVFAAATPEQREQILKYHKAREAVKETCLPISELPAYLPEDKNPNVLFKGGPWLERGCGAFFIGSSGIGKSIYATQLMLAACGGVEFGGLVPSAALKILYAQSEDTENRMARDFADTLAELQEKYPHVGWDSASERLEIWNATGRTGRSFLEGLDEQLEYHRLIGKPIDLVVVNPLHAFIGGPVADGALVTPFLRGGDLNHEHVDGLQLILERNKCGVLIFHHTPKPPAPSEIKAWLSSPYPEYQGAGSAEITNWGRSCLTMFRITGYTDRVFITAGKNGSRLGWEKIGGAYRRYLCYSGKDGVDGLRNAWRDATDDESTENDAALEKLTGMKKSENTSKVEKEINIAPYVIRALDEARAKTLAGSLFQGLNQGDMIKSLKSIIGSDGKASPGKPTLKRLLEELPEGFVSEIKRKINDEMKNDDETLLKMLHEIPANRICCLNLDANGIFYGMRDEVARNLKSKSKQ